MSFLLNFVQRVLPHLTPEQQAEIEKHALEREFGQLVERIMALPPLERSLLAEFVRRESAAAGEPLPPYPE